MYKCPYCNNKIFLHTQKIMYYCSYCDIYIHTDDIKLNRCLNEF